MNTLPSAETPDVAELRRLAEAATPGPWWHEWVDGDDWWAVYGQPTGDMVCPEVCTMWGSDESAYIAAANPAVVLGLLDATDALRAELAHMCEARDAQRAEVERLTAIVNSDVFEATRGGVRIPRFDVPYPGGSTTADFMRTMAKRLPSKGVMGSNCSNTAASILAAYADALDALDGGQR